MLIALFIIILGVNLFLAFWEKTFKCVILLTNFLIFVLLTGSRDEIDLKSYLIIYDMPDIVENGFQILFYGLMKNFHHLGFSFFEFRGLIFGISLFCIYVFFRKISLNMHLMYSFYMLYLLFLDYIQFRNCFGASLFYVALLFLVLQKKNWKIWFSVFVVLASLVHSSFWAYLIFLLIPSERWENAKMIKTIALLAFSFSIFVVFFRNALSFTTDVISIVDGEKSLRYAERSTNFGGLYFIFLHLFSSFIIGLMSWKYDDFHGGHYALKVDGELINVKRSLRMIFYVDLLAFALCPFIVYSITFYRLLRNLYLLNIAGFSIYGLKNRSVCMTFLLVFYSILWIFIEFGGDNFRRLVLPLFETNVYF